MNSNYKKLQLLVWGGLAMVIAFVVAGYVRTEFLTKSPLRIISQIGNFTLTNQLAQEVGLNDLLGKVWVADIIFSRCAGPCPKMTERMEDLQSSFEPAAGLRFVTLTTDPDYDTPKILKSWSEKFHADPVRWWFLTGAKAEIRKVAVDGMKLTAIEKKQGEQETPVDLFIHSTIFALIDKRGELRGVYESLEPDFKEKITRDIRGLLREKL